MIYEINSDFPNFRPIELTSGVNIILAEKKVNSTNSVGKSLFLELINYILGADFSKNVLSRYEELQEFTIKITMDIDGKRREYSRIISKENNNSIIDYGKLDDWKENLFLYFFEKETDSNILTWRNLFHFFYQNKTSVKFETALKSFKSEPEYKTSLFQSFLLDLATNEIEAYSQTKQITSEKNSFNKYLNTLKKSLKVIPELVPDIEDITNENNKILKELTSTKLEIIQLEKKINLLTSKNNKLKVTLDDLRKKTSIHSFEDFDSFFRIIETELEQYVKKTFEEAQVFHNNLVLENISVINSEIAKNQANINNLETKLKSKYSKLNQLINIHESNNSEFEEYNIENIILNNLVQNGGQVITSIIDKNIKEVAKIKDQEIPKIILNQNEMIQNYRRFLTTFVNLVYKSDKNVEFDIYYNKKFIVHFKYDDDTGTGKGNMKIIIYYIFILLLNNSFLQRKIDFLILDTDITDGIDSNNLLDLLKITDRLFKKHNLQLILTLRNDRKLDWDYVEKKGWIKHRLSDSDDGYLFKPNLK